MNKGIFIGTVALAVSICAVSLTGLCDEEHEDVRSMPTRELEKGLDEVRQRIDELEVQKGYLRTEPPDGFYDSREVERTGFSETQIKSELLNPRAETNTLKELEKMRKLKADIKEELDRRGSEGMAVNK